MFAPRLIADKILSENDKFLLHKEGILKLETNIKLGIMYDIL